MTLKRILRPAMALLLAAACLFCAACSTPKVAMTVGGKDYEMGDYLAYLYNTVSSDYTVMMYSYYYGQQMGYGTNVLSATDLGLTYGDSTQAITLNDYIHYVTQDTIYRQRAMELMLQEEGISWDKDELAKVEADIKNAGLEKDAFIEMGFSNERYINMYKAVTLNEMSLFNGRYNKGGTKEVPETEIRKYFDENYLSYFIIEESLVDSSGAAISTAKEDGLKEIMGKVVSTFEGYKDEEKTVENFQKLYHQYLADKTALEAKLKADADKQKEDTDKEAADKEDKKTDTTGSTAAPTTTTSTTVTTTTTGTTTTTTGSSTGSSTGSTDKEEKEEDLARTDSIIEDMDEELVKAVQGVKLADGKTCAIELVEYKKSGTTDTLAVIFRLDPEAQRGKDSKGKEIDYYEESRDKTLQYLKYDQFSADVDAKVKTLKASAKLNKRAFKAVEMAKLLGLE